MKATSLFFGLVVTLFIASTASAALPISYKEIPQDQTQPTVTACNAYSWYGQKCRDCRANFNTDGSVNSWVCVQVEQSNFFCTCGDMSKGGCAPKGQCTYR